MQVTERYISIRGEQIYCFSIGQGEPIVFLHGGPGSEHRTFLPHIEPLAEYFTLHLYDQRGCGKSERAAAPDPYTIQNEVETLEGLRQSLQIDKLNLVGESWGTMLALFYACTYPERVAGIVLSSAIGISKKGFVLFGEELLQRMSPADKQAMNAVEQKLANNHGNLKELFEILDPYYVYNRDTLLKVSETAPSPDINESISQDIMANYDLTDQAHLLAQIPITILQGENDILRPSLLPELLLEHVPHAELKRIQRCGHWVFVEQSVQFNDTVKNFFETKSSV